MKKYTIIFIFLLVWCVLPAFAAIPQGYYNGVSGKTSDAALAALYSTIKDHNVISYSNLEDYYGPIDFDSAGYLMDMYSTCTFTIKDANCSQKSVCDCWNKEHSIPQSWFNEKSPMKSDLFHVVPTDARVNNYRSNMPYGETSSTAYIDKNPKALGHIGSSNFQGYTGQVYEPDNQFKGDFARIYFYMCARYREQALNSSSGSVVFTSNPTNLSTYATNLFLKWHRQDPVSQREIQRNEAVYKVQKNRNPFVDYPYLVEYIWGIKKGSKVDFTQMISSLDPTFIPGVSDGQLVTKDPTLYADASSMVFTNGIEGESQTQTFTVRGINLTQDIVLSISGTNAAYFSVSPSAVNVDSALHPRTITVTYLPLQQGTHLATLSISSYGADTRTISLQGACNASCTVTWLVDGIPYTAGDPTMNVAFGSAVSQLPTAPKSCSEQSEQFVGWTQFVISQPNDSTPYDLFSDASEAQPITTDVVYRACFAHITKTQGEDKTYTFSSSSKDWTITNTSLKNGYYVLNSKASITSPEVDLSVLKSVSVTARTYGGAQYNIVSVSGNDKHICSLEAKSKSLVAYTWTRPDSVLLMGEAPLVFSSSTSSADNGPGVSIITIVCGGTKYVYSKFLTECTLSPTQDIRIQTSLTDRAHKYIRDGKLVIQIDGRLYTIYGQILE